MDFTRKHNIIVKDNVIFEKGTDGDIYYDKNECGIKLKGSDDKITVLARKKYVDDKISTLKKYVDNENKKQDVKIDKNASDIVDLSARVTVNETDIDNLQIGYTQLNTDVSALNQWHSKLTEHDTPDWIDLTLGDGFTFDVNGYAGYKVSQGILNIILYRIKVPDGLSETLQTMTTLPTEITNLLKSSMGITFSISKASNPNTAQVSATLTQSNGQINCTSIPTIRTGGVYSGTFNIPLG